MIADTTHATRLCFVVQASLGLRSSLWSCNPMLAAWEPVIEPWDVIIKLDSNRGQEVDKTAASQSTVIFVARHTSLHNSRSLTIYADNTSLYRWHMQRPQERI